MDRGPARPWRGVVSGALMAHRTAVVTAAATYILLLAGGPPPSTPARPGRPARPWRGVFSGALMAHRTAVVTAAATYILLLAGGLVHSTGAGLACPDWPLCYGMWLPPLVGDIRFEHSHRLIAGTVGILTLITSALVL